MVSLIATFTCAVIAYIAIGFLISVVLGNSGIGNPKASFKEIAICTLTWPKLFFTK